MLNIDLLCDWKISEIRLDKKEIDMKDCCVSIDSFPILENTLH